MIGKLSKNNSFIDRETVEKLTVSLFLNSSTSIDLIRQRRQINEKSKRELLDEI
jgi:hypothetical protein